MYSFVSTSVLFIMWWKGVMCREDMFSRGYCKRVRFTVSLSSISLVNTKRIFKDLVTVLKHLTELHILLNMRSRCAGCKKREMSDLASVCSVEEAESSEVKVLCM
eukprot:GHVR01117338.1.p3 GENE.GHVR01117338.1~~GHVR01117338.1.p3  ORF type:complete len:105 (+),score=13.58 GHVR01117338.1:1414-1728(+)